MKQLMPTNNILNPQCGIFEPWALYNIGNELQKNNSMGES